MTASLFVLPSATPVNGAGRPHPGALLYFYLAGTNTPATVYANAARTVPHTQPVEANSDGVFPPIWLDPTVSYASRMTTSGGVLLPQGTCDPYPGSPSGDLSRTDLLTKLRVTTAAETAAGVTPTNLAYPEGDVRAYGAVGDGVTVDTAAIARAVSVARYSGFLYFSPAASNGRTIYLTDDITIPSGVTVECGPNVTVKKYSGTGTNTFLFRMDNYALGSATLLTANAKSSDKTVAVASVANLQVGQTVLIRDNTYAYGTTGRNQEINEIESIASLNVTFKNRLMGSYTTANASDVVPFTTENRDITFKNVKGEIPAGVGGGIFYSSYGYNHRFINCEGVGPEKRGVLFSNCTNCTIEGGYIHDGQDVTTSGNGYGYTFGASRNCHALGVRTKNIRENSIASGSAFCSIRECYDEGAYDSSWNTHADGNHDNLIANNISIGAYAKAIVIGFDSGLAADYRNIVRDNLIINCGATGIESYSSVGTEQYDNVIEGNTIDGYAKTTGTKYGIYLENLTRPRVLNNRILNGTTTNAISGLRIINCTAGIISGNLIDGVPSGTGMRHNNCTGLVIRHNDFRNIDAASPGVFGSSTASTGVVVTNNTSDNDIAFTKNSGDVHRGNIYATKFDEDSGATSVADGGTVTHKCVRTPTRVICTAPTSGEFVSVTAIASSNFTVAIKTHSNGAGTTAAIYWEAA